MAKEGPPEIVEQKRMITALLQKPLVEGDLWYLVNTKWFGQWKKYVHYDSCDTYITGGKDQHPGPVDNSGIIKAYDVTNSQCQQIFQPTSGPELAKMMKIGTRVVRGKDWKYTNQDGLPPGEGCVTENRRPDGWIKVSWDKGGIYMYRMGQDGKYDLKLAGSQTTMGVVKKEDCSINQQNELVEIKDHLMEELDYVLLPEEGWLSISSWYGLTDGQKPIARRVVKWGMLVKSCKLEVYLTQFTLCEYNNMAQMRPVKFSKGDTIETVETMMRNEFGIPEREVTRLWNFTTGCYRPLFERSKTLQDVEINHGQLLIIERRNEDGRWALKTPDTRSSHCYHKIKEDVVVTREKLQRVGVDRNVQIPQLKQGICGIVVDAGNISFMSSVLQCMSNVSPLTKYFISDQYIDDLNTGNNLGMGGRIGNSYANQLKRMWSGQHSSVTMKELKIQVRRFAPQFWSSQQQDAHTFSTFLLDAFHEDLNRVIDKPTIEAKGDYDGTAEEISAQEKWQEYLKQNDSIIVDLFHGLSKYTVVCPDTSCGKASVNFEPFSSLSLPVPHPQNSSSEIEPPNDTNLMECLKLYIAEGCVEKSWYCTSCETFQDAPKKIGLLRLPKVLIIHLDRSSKRHSSNETNSPVNYVLGNLDLNEQVTGNETPKNYKYDLTAVINLSGEPGDGHYTTYAKNFETKNWYKFDDDNVAVIPSEQAATSNDAYMLFYIRPSFLL